MRREQWIGFGSAVLVAAALVASMGNNGLLVTFAGLLAAGAMVVAVTVAVRGHRQQEPWPRREASAAAPAFDVRRAMLGVAGAAALLFGAFLGWIVTIIVASGCFIGCNEENRNLPLAVAIGLVVLAMVAGAGRLAGWGLQLAATVTSRVVVVAVVVAAMVLVGSVAFG